MPFSFYRVNIQSRPTATLYEKKDHAELIFHEFALQGFAFVESTLKVAVVPVGNYEGEAVQGFGFIQSELAVVIIDIGSYNGLALQDFGFQESVLNTVIIDVGNYNGEALQNFGFINSDLKTVVIPVWTDPTSPINQSYGLSQSSLA